MDKTGRRPWDWQTITVAVLAAALFVMTYLAAGGCVSGAGPVSFAAFEPVSFAAFGPPAAAGGAAVRGTAGPPPVLLGWTFTRPDGSSYFVPAAPAGAVTYPPAPGVAAPRPFAGPVAGSTPTTSAINVGPASTSSPVPARSRGLIRTGVRGAATSGFTSGCTGYG